MGATLPQDLMPPEAMNARGFFESVEITGFDEDLLASFGFTWWDCRRVPQDWFDSLPAQDFARRASQVLLASYGGADLIVVKDPRHCRLMPFWRPVLQDAGYDPLIVLTYRALPEVAASLEAWAKYDPDYAAVLWLRHLLDGEAETRGMRRVFVSYEALLTDWRGVVEKVSHGLGVTWPRPLAAAASEVESFLSRELQHFGGPAASGQAEPEGQSWFAEVAKIFTQWSKTGEDRRDYPKLDAIREGLDAANPPFAALAHRAQEMWHRSEPQGGSRHVQDLERRCQRLERQLRQSQSEMALLSERAGLRLKAELAAELQIVARNPAPDRPGAAPSTLARLERERDAARVALATERRAARAEKQRLKHQIDSLKTSLSWRVTAPLRRLSRMLRR
jgi:hypothetical protein